MSVGEPEIGEIGEIGEVAQVAELGSPPAAAAAASRTPQVWVLTEGRAGDDGQLLALAEALGGGTTVLELRGNSNWNLVLDRLRDWGVGGGLPIRLPADAPPDWPDLVLAIAGRSVSTSRRIVRASGGRTRSVHLGRPVADLRSFDLVITTPQYGLPAAANLVHTPLPFCPPPLLRVTVRVTSHCPSTTIHRFWPLSPCRRIVSPGENSTVAAISTICRRCASLKPAKIDICAS